MMLNRLTAWLRFAIAAALSVAAASSFAATETKVNDDALAPLRASVVTRHIRLDALPLAESTRSVIDLEEFQVWAPGGKVIIHGDNGKVTVEDPTPMRFFRGLVNGDPETFAYLSIDNSGQIYGLIATRDHRYAITARRRPGTRNAPGARSRDDAGMSYDHFLTMGEDTDEMEPGRTWECAGDKYNMAPLAASNQTIHAGTDTFKPRPNGLTGTQTYGITVEVETDYELYLNAGNSTTLQNYITNLTGAVSTIYNRDLKTNVTQSAVDIYTTVSDPWAATDPTTGLYELGNYYNSTKSRTTSEVVFISGKNILAGIAWEGVACSADFTSGSNHGGPYAWCAGITTGSIPDPNGTQNSVQYGMPTSNYWPLAEYAHEMGHNLAGHHTHCVAITDQERGAAQFADSSPSTSVSNFVDHCYGHEGLAGCWSSTTDYVAGSQSVFNGTIMSYCHNVFVGIGYPQSRFIFGVASEPSHHELDDYMLNASGPLGSPFGKNIVTGTTATLSAITAPSSVGASSTGNTASVTNTAGQTYSWSITGGSITAGGSTSSVTFSAGASGSVVLTVDATNSTRCSLRDSKTITIGSAIAAPTNVNAAAQSTTSVLIQWTASAGATSYEVVRSADHVTYSASPVCTATSSATNCTDPTASASTAYLYKVRASAPSVSAYSSPDLATTIIFTDPTLTQQSTPVKAVHINELRTAVNKVCTLAGTTATYTTAAPSVGTSIIQAADINDLRAAINTARSTMSLSAATYTTSAPSAGISIIQAADINDLRTAVQ